MTPDATFKVASTIALLAWILLVAQGWKRWVSGLVTAMLVPGFFAAIYVVIVAVQWGHSRGDFNSLPGVAALFSNPWLLLAGWIHYLGFDLFVGSWEARDARANRIPHWLVIPCLLLTFLFGPAGFLAYACLKAVRVRRSTIEDLS